MSEKTYRWCEAQLDLTPALRRRVKSWMLQAALDSDGTVWVPHVVAGSEMEVFLCASYDGTPVLMSEGHAYYPADWVAREFAIAADTVRNIETHVRQHFAEHP
jgi:hypothetical protein